MAAHALTARAAANLTTRWASLHVGTASQRDLLSSAVGTRFASILTTNGYRTSIGGRLRSWQTTPPEWSDLPILHVTDPSDAIEPPAYGVTRHTLTVVAEVILHGGTALTTLRDHAADILQAVGVDPTWGGLAEGSRAVSVDLDPGETNRVSAGVAVGLEIEFETALWAT